MTTLDILTRAERMLAEVRDATDAVDAIKAADLAADLARRIDLGTAAVNHALFIKAKAMRLLADVVDEGQKKGEIATPGKPRATDDNSRGANNKPAPIPVPAPRLAEARRIRDAFTEDELEAEFTKATEDDKELSTRRLVAKAASVTQKPEPVAETPAMPTGLYRAVVIDPPWPIAKIEREERPHQGTGDLAYPTMAMDDIRALPLPDLLDPDGAHVYLWTTHKFLPDALDLFEHWGVRYQCLMTWNKNVGITPFSWMYDTEHVLFGNYGQGLKLAQLGMRLSFSAPVQGHSVKPEVFYERVRAASPGARLDMFNRRDIDGFEPWGREAARGHVR